DYLASKFVEKKWSLKSMHRLVMLSRTYQQSSAADEVNAKLDVSNDYLWKFDRRRLDAESIRDTLLAVGGNLDRAPGPAHPFPDPKGWNFTQHNPFKAVYDTDKRSVYVMTQRFQRHPFFALFDGADTNASTDRRLVSTTPPQAQESASAKEYLEKVTAKSNADRAWESLARSLFLSNEFVYLD